MDIKTDKKIKVKDIFEITSKQEPLEAGKTMAVHNMSGDIIGFALVQKHFKPDPNLFLLKIVSLVSTRKIKERRVPSWKT
jgi:hypothetical protein